MDIYPAPAQRQALLNITKALGSRSSALRADECGDPVINGSKGHIIAVCGATSDPPTSILPVRINPKLLTSFKARFRRPHRAPSTSFSLRFSSSIPNDRSSSSLGAVRTGCEGGS